MSHLYKEFRCTVCKKLLFKGILVDSAVEIKCKRCGTMNEFEGVPSNELVCLISPCPNRITAQTKVK